MLLIWTILEYSDTIFDFSRTNFVFFRSISGYSGSVFDKVGLFINNAGLFQNNAGLLIIPNSIMFTIVRCLEMRLNLRTGAQSFACRHTIIWV